MELDEGERESKFAHLLKPIKDLADNFDVDIAAELFEYLEELDKIVINFEGGELNLNFAEAALLIQGSTMVYSKKVEHLYSLVFNVLDLLCDGKTNVQAESKKNKRKSMVTAPSKERDEFLLLDDVISIGKNIDMVPDNMETTQGLRARIPIALVAGRGNNTETSAAFKMMSCDVDASGAFMLEKSSKKGDMISSGDGMTDRTLAARASSDEGFEEHALADENGEEDLGDEQGYVSPGGSDPGDAFAFEGDDALMNDDHGNNEEGALENGYGSEEEEMEDEGPDPWERLDPHDHGDKSNDAPLLVKKTWKTPKVLQSKTLGTNEQALLFTNLMVSLALKPKLATQLPSRDGSVLYPEFQPYAAAIRNQKRASRRNRKRGAMQPEEFAQNEQDQRIEDEEDELAKSLVRGANHNDEVGLGNNDGSDQVYYPGPEMDDDQGDFFYDGGDDNGEDDDGLQPNRLNLDEMAFDGAHDAYVDMVKLHLQQYLETANKWATESRLHSRVRTWEERIEPLLAEQNQHPPFNIHAYGTVILRRLALRVPPKESDSDDPAKSSTDDGTISFDDLSARLGAVALPKSKGEDADSDEEEENVISNEAEYDADKNPQPLEQFEVCRLFLASLQLANNGNVELVHETNNSELRFRLLDNVQADEKLRGFRAPSLQDENQQDPVKARAKRARKPSDLHELENM
mmetsp:Transcript_8244/g.14588  ORF Transcript_8244/g.14588 Transcript_8244/m.14588 type:complete len:689 (-) Transcript_8244:60-2126(-)|eukprot:CAMPEP_0184549132 /NCGR_PEP_ID=MMETSP0199_2-20130426/6614_1 /TAXON_ID=1112570 /ORGANISM="Thraustochytrium sp., Strain LLF1b" /LENGTH=688 /DNA_ID=CAMNT_0026943817 /DNA_START=202 /DNA_END=2268 /DNA_ORIENTATION=-